MSSLPDARRSRPSAWMRGWRKRSSTWFENRSAGEGRCTGSAPSSRTRSRGNPARSSPVLTQLRPGPLARLRALAVAGAPGRAAGGRPHAPARLGGAGHQPLHARAHRLPPRGHAAHPRAGRLTARDRRSATAPSGVRRLPAGRAARACTARLGIRCRRRPCGPAPVPGPARSRARSPRDRCLFGKISASPSGTAMLSALHTGCGAVW